MKIDKQDNEIYILGSDAKEKNGNAPSNKKWLILAGIVILSVIAICIFITLLNREQAPEYLFEPENLAQQTVVIAEASDSSRNAYAEVLYDTINDVPLAIYIPHKAAMLLVLGMPDKSDTTIVYATMAADIRKDNKEIVGDFVLNGQRLSRGVAKKGFCAIVDNTISLGMGDDTPLLKESIDKNGSFFRQYPLVCEGVPIENKPKNKSKRRALAISSERMAMVESINNESFHDFSQALADMGFWTAIYLVGGNAHGWYRDKEHTRHEYGDVLTEIPENISYIVWRAK